MLFAKHRTETINITGSGQITDINNDIMNGLVGYASSDDEEDIQSEKPAKVGRHQVFSLRRHGYLLTTIGTSDSKDRDDNRGYKRGYNGTYVH